MAWKIAGGIGLSILAVLAVLHAEVRTGAAAQVKEPVSGVPTFEVDPGWPRAEGHFGVNGTWIIGAIGGIAVDSTTQHVWVLQRPRTLDDSEDYAARKPPVSDCCVPAPPVLEFDADGRLVNSWGGSGPGYDWPRSEHGITIDDQGYVWIGGNGTGDNQFLKFTKAGKFVMQIGHPGRSTGSRDTKNLNEPTKAFVYQKTKEVFIADGYLNRRVIVFDADTGAFKRLWGAYGKPPDDTIPRIRRAPFDNAQALPLKTLSSGPAPKQFNLVHSVLISHDDLVYVADRSNNRIQVFKPDGTFVKEAFLARGVRTPVGTATDLAASPDARQQFLYVVSGDERVRILDRGTLQEVGRVGRLGYLLGQFHHVHVIAVDAKGNLYTGEATATGRRIEKFTFKGVSPVAPQQRRMP